MRGAAIGLLIAFGACTDVLDTSAIDQSATVCGAGPTVAGMDVSYYDDSVDWNAAHAAGIEFAFVRVTDGTQYQDPKFAEYWAGARAAGVIRGAYQFFRPAEDPIAQADLLVQLMGPLQPGDLPPVLDLEDAGGLTTAEVTANAQAWVDRITQTVGQQPIVYAGLYSWPTLTGGADLTASQLWIAQYTTAACPDIPAPWTNWMFWQHSDTGAVDGVVSSQLDLDVFNGTIDQLMTFAVSGAPSCGTIPSTGNTIDDADPCFTPGGPAADLRHVTDAGYGGGLIWTHTTQAADEANYGQWDLDFAAAGMYEVEVYTAAAYAQSHAASYAISASGAVTSVTIDQTAVDGWQSLGAYMFAAGRDQSINLGDNTGEPTAEQLVFDAVRITPVDSDGSGAVPPGTDPDPITNKSGGCSTTTGTAGPMLVGLVLVVLRCRRRRSPAKIARY